MSDIFSYINSINDHEYKMEEPENEKEYNAFLTLRAFSYFPDTILVANEMNMFGKLDNKMQYDFLFFSVSKKKRYSKWFKKEKDEDIDLIQEVFKCNYQRASEINNILSMKQKNEIRKKLENGGEIKSGKHSRETN